VLDAFLIGPRVDVRARDGRNEHESEDRAHGTIVPWTLAAGKTLRYRARVKWLASLALAMACGSKTPPSLAPPHQPAAETGSDDNPLVERRLEYADFFGRMKRAVYTEWQPSAVWKGLSPDERKGPPTLETVVRVTMLASGDLEDVTIKKSSGITALDDSGVQAFRAAAPFMNPPPGLFINGECAFDFSFFFDTTSGAASPAPP
jgi:TonB family protein